MRKQQTFPPLTRSPLMAFAIGLLTLSVAVATQSGIASADTASAAVPQAAYKLPAPVISTAFPFESHYAEVLGSRLHYVESGSGAPVVFLHGNPTSSYLWRNVIPHVAAQGRAIAPDLIGMGKSGKPDIAYTFADHRRYLGAFITALDLNDITFVVHDWGAALGFDYARRNPGRVKAIAFMEGVLPPAFPQPSFEAMGEEMGGMFRALKDPVQGEKLVIDDNMFVEQVLPGFVNRPLGNVEMTAYRAPYLDKASRKPVLVWPREIPIAGEPAGVVTALGEIGAFMEKTDLPMLLLYASPGVLVPPAAVPWYAARIANLETSYVGQGFHFIQEDQPEAIGRAIADWMRRH